MKIYVKNTRPQRDFPQSTRASSHRNAWHQTRGPTWSAILACWPSAHPATVLRLWVRGLSWMPVGFSLEASGEPLGASFEASWGSLGGLLGPLSGLLGPLWGFLRACWRSRGSPWGGGLEISVRVPPLGPLLEPFWAVVGASWAVLVPSWAVLGLSWGLLRPSWSDIGGLLSRLGRC